MITSVSLGKVKRAAADGAVMKPARMRSSCERGTGRIETGESPRSPWRTIYVAMETHAIALRKLVLKSRALLRQHKKTTNAWPLYFLKNTACTEGPNRHRSFARAQ